MNHLHRVLTSILVLVLITMTAGAQDWPQWRGPDRDGKTDSLTAPETWPQSLTRRWNTQVGVGDSTPALVDNR